MEDNRERLKDLYDKQVNVNGGELTLSGNNSYNGGTTIANGTIVNGGVQVVQPPANFTGGVAQQAAQPNAGAVALGTTPTPNYPQGGVQYSTPGTQSGLIMTGAGTLTLAGSNTYSSATVVSGGMLQLGTGGNTTFSGVINNGGTLQYANPNLANGRIILNNEQAFGGQGNVGNANDNASSTVSGTISNMGGMGGGMMGAGGGPQAGVAQVRAPNSMPLFRNYAAAQQANPSAQGLAEPQQPSFGRRGKVRDDQQRELAEYQQKLAVNPSQLAAQDGEQAEAEANDENKAVEHRRRSVPSASSAAAPPPAKAPTPGKTDTMVVHEDVCDMLARTASTAPAGFASLDFELPTDTNLYEIHRFTTPRGEAELTVRTASNDTLARLELLAEIAAAGLLIWVAFWLIRRGLLGWFRRPLGAALLAILGLASLCSSVLPAVGLLALLTGIGLLIAHFWRRRAGAM